MKEPSFVSHVIMVGCKGTDAFVLSLVARPFQCECRSEGCLKLIGGASNMDVRLLEARGYFINDHILKLMQKRSDMKN